MNLYKLTDSTVKVGYEWGCYLSCVIAAESEEQARLIHPGSDRDYVTYKWEDNTWKYKMNYSEEWCNTRCWGNPKELVLELIGIADASITKPKVILSEFLQ